MQFRNHTFILVLMAVALACISEAEAPAQRMAAGKGSISTNVAGYANLLTLNAEASVPVARHWTLNAGAKYNPFSFGKA